MRSWIIIRKLVQFALKKLATGAHNTELSVVHQKLFRVTRFLQFENPILETGDAVTELHPNVVSKSWDSKQVTLNCTLLRNKIIFSHFQLYVLSYHITSKNMKSKVFGNIYDILKTYVLEHELMITYTVPIVINRLCMILIRQVLSWIWINWNDDVVYCFFFCAWTLAIFPGIFD